MNRQHQAIYAAAHAVIARHQGEKIGVVVAPERFPGAVEISREDLFLDVLYDRDAEKADYEASILSRAGMAAVLEVCTYTRILSYDGFDAPDDFIMGRCRRGDPFAEARRLVQHYAAAIAKLAWRAMQQDLSAEDVEAILAPMIGGAA
jgi:hypothetical protein